MNSVNNSSPEPIHDETIKQTSIQKLENAIACVHDMGFSEHEYAALDFINEMSEAKYSIFFNSERANRWNEVKQLFDSIISKANNLSNRSAKILHIHNAYKKMQGMRIQDSGYF